MSELLITSATKLLGSRLASPVVLPSNDVDLAVYKLEKAITTHQEKLRQLAADRLAAAAALRNSLGPSPKRRASDEDGLRANGYVMLNLVARFISINLACSSLSSKRLRASVGENDEAEFERDTTSVSPPPSTSALTETSEKPIVTVAMLRALTRDVLGRYKK